MRLSMLNAGSAFGASFLSAVFGGSFLSSAASGPATRNNRATTPRPRRTACILDLQLERDGNGMAGLGPGIKIGSPERGLGGRLACTQLMPAIAANSKALLSSRGARGLYDRP